jgi:hypothetical protein
MVTIDEGTFKTVKLNNRSWCGRVLGVNGERLYFVRDIHSDRGPGRNAEEKYMLENVSFETTPIENGSRLEHLAS